MYKLPEVKNPHFYVFGTGGTGGFALEYMTRLFANYDGRVTIDIYDGDTVESKNLKRQNFVVEDLDKKKATALHERLSKQVLTPPIINEHTEYVTDGDELMAEILMNTEDDETAIIVSAVDNIATRRLVNGVVDDLTGSIPVIGIDSGNHDQGGQVVLFSNEEAESKDVLGNTSKVKLDNMLKLFPEIDVIKDDRDENPGIVSVCMEESESKPQSMMANVRNGEVIASLTWQIATNQSFQYNVWYSDVMTQGTNGEFKTV